MLSSVKNLMSSLILAGLILQPALADDWQVDGVGRVIAISDVHGAYQAMIETLTKAGVLDEEHAWIGGDAHLVIVGDLLDRGPRSRDAMDLVMRLETEAQAAGGYVHVLIGNHEMMNMIGDLRYVSKEEYAAFAADETDAQRDRWLAAYARRKGESDPDDLRERFNSTFPPGYFALREAFGAQGQYGKWLLAKPVIAVINQTAFVHGGLPPIVADIGLQGINVDLKRELTELVDAIGTLVEAEVLLPTDNYYEYEKIVADYRPDINETPEVLAALAVLKNLVYSTLTGREGPLWYRGSVACSRIVEEHRLDASLAAIGATRVVVGHTPTPLRKVLQRFDGSVIEIDTGMLSAYYRGSGNALVLAGDDISVVNQQGGDPYAPIPHPRSVGSRPDNLTVEQLATLLETGDVMSQEKTRIGTRTIVEIGDGTHTVKALFSKSSGRGVYPDMAAYRLDRLLGLDMVPVTVLREVDGDPGSLQFFPDKTTDEAKRSSEKRGSSAPCPIADQWMAMYLFDVLAFNEGRSQKRMLYDPRTWNLILIEHDQAFRAGKGRPSHLRNVSLDVSDGWRSALERLTDEVLQAEFGDILDKRRLKALGTRRDLLLSE